MIRRLAATSAAFVLALGFAPALGADAPGPSGLRVVDRIAGPDGGWDYAFFDDAHHRVYVAHGTEVLAVNVTTDKLNPKFATGAGLHSVLPIPGTDELLTTNSKDKTVKIISAKDGALIASLAVDDDADGAAWDPATRLAVITNGDPGELTLIDVAARKVVGTIKIGDPVEFLAPDGKGKLFVNIETKGEVAVVDLKARKVLTRYAMADCKRPTGLAYVSGGRLISSCNGLAKILDAANGHEIDSLPIGGFPDSVLYDPQRQLAYVPTALDGQLNVIALSGAHNNQIIDKVPTQIGARTGAVDPKTGRVYLPTAEYILPVPAGQRPTTKPGTFTVLVLDRK